MNLYNEFFNIIQAFEENQITYAVIGGFAMAFHDKPRFTEDIDFLISNASLNKADQVVNELAFFSSTDPHHFLETTLTLYRYVKTFNDDYLILDLLSSPKKRFQEILRNSIAYEWEKGTVAVVNRENLILLKRMRNSEQDKVDIMNLKNDASKNSDRKKS